MYFYVFIDPEVIPESASIGPVALERLVSVLRTLEQNCFLTDFDSYHVRNEISRHLGPLHGDWEVKMLKTLLIHFERRGLFVNCLKHDWDSDASVGEMAVKQQESNEIALILLTEDDHQQFEANPTVTTASRYAAMDFDDRVRAAAAQGAEPPAGELDSTAFMEKYLKKALRSASRIEIIDRQCGENYKDNYDYTIERFMKWLESLNPSASIVFHLGFPAVSKSTVVTDADLAGLDPSQIEPTKAQILAATIRRHTSNPNIRIHCYEGTLDHQRYIVTNQVAFSLDMGMDFLDPKTGKNRRVSMSLKDGRMLLAGLPVPGATA